MRRLVIIDQDGNSIKMISLKKYLILEKVKLKENWKVRESFIKENNLKDITHDDVIKEIQTIPNIDSRQKKRIL